MAQTEAQQAEAALKALAESIDAQIELFKADRLAAGAEEYRAAQVYSQVLQSGAFLTPFQVVDGAANRTRGWTLNNPIEYGTQAVTYIQRITPAGVMDREAIITPDDDSKADGSSGVQSGTKLIVMPTAHALATPPRENGVYEVGIDGWCVEYPVDHPQVGKAGAFVASEGGGGGGGVTADEVQAIVDGAVAQIKGQDNITLKVVVDNILPKTKIGVEQLFDGANGSHIVYSQLRATSYSGALDAIRDADKPEEPPQ